MDPSVFPSAYAPLFARKGKGKLKISIKTKTKPKPKPTPNNLSTKPNDPELDNLLGGFVIGNKLPNFTSLPTASIASTAPSTATTTISTSTSTSILTTTSSTPKTVKINYIKDAHVDIVEIKGKKYYFHRNKFYSTDTGKLVGRLKSGLILLNNEPITLTHVQIAVCESDTDFYYDKDGFLYSICDEGVTKVCGELQDGELGFYPTNPIPNPGDKKNA